MVSADSTVSVICCPRALLARRSAAYSGPEARRYHREAKN
jgi:hypothetical protein